MANLNPILKHYSQLRRIKREKMNASMHVIDEMYQIAHIENRFNKLNMKKKQIKLIKEAYNSAEVNCEWKAKIKETFPDIEFERELPKTWDAYVKMTECGFVEMNEYHRIILGSNSGYSSGIIVDSKPTTRQPKYTTLRKLELLRDYYNDGWKGEDGGVIWYTDDGLDVDTWRGKAFLKFKTEDLAGTFYTNFKDLIIQAEDLI